MIAFFSNQFSCKILFMTGVSFLVKIAFNKLADSVLNFKKKSENWVTIFKQILFESVYFFLFDSVKRNHDILKVSDKRKHSTGCCQHHYGIGTLYYFLDYISNIKWFTHFW